jgi:hypothetical protein
MLVSMECLIGAAYTKMAQAQGLTCAVRPSMGRVDACFLDPRIGVASEWAQLWIDRSFPLDYTLKSLEKVLDGHPRYAVRGARTVLKDAAYTVLGLMLAEIDATAPGGSDVDGMSERLRKALDGEIAALRERVAPEMRALASVLPPRRAEILREQHERWAAEEGWRLINAADPCGT